MYYVGVELKPGTRLQSVVCTTQVIVIRAPSEAADLRCGGHPLVTPDQPGQPVRPDQASTGLEIEPGFDGGTVLGKRYTDERQSLELLCTKAGRGSLSVGAEPLVLSGAKPLPASD
jgi:hypothetical protein